MSIDLLRAIEDLPTPEVLVVGDTPRDVACGKFQGTRTVAVATGRFDALEPVAGVLKVLP